MEWLYKLAWRHVDRALSAKAHDFCVPQCDDWRALQVQGQDAAAGVARGPDDHQGRAAGQNHRPLLLQRPHLLPHSGAAGKHQVVGGVLHPGKTSGRLTHDRLPARRLRCLPAHLQLLKLADRAVL